MATARRAKRSGPRTNRGHTPKRRATATARATVATGSIVVVPIDPGDVGGTLDAVLVEVRFRNANGQVLNDFSIGTSDVTLRFA